MTARDYWLKDADDYVALCPDHLAAAAKDYREVPLLCEEPWVCGDCKYCATERHREREEKKRPADHEYLWGPQ